MFDFDDQPPQYPLPRDIVPHPVSERVEADYQWLERYIPYDSSTESNVHWFLRFK